MKQTKQNQFGPMDIPLTCSIFLEPALQRFRPYISPLTPDIVEFVHEWNCALIDTVSAPVFRPYLGKTGLNIINNTLKNNIFPTRCVESARDVPVQSLHYALRFSESINFLKTKIESGQTDAFVDLGCGFSPTAAAIHNTYNYITPYCIDIPEIMTVYNQVATKVNGKAPYEITWDDAVQLAQSKKLDTIVAMGVLPYINLSEQVSRMKFINNNIPNFMLEIKYNNDPQNKSNPNVFNLDGLQKLRMDVGSAQNLETTVMRNSMRYLHKFMSAMPDRRYFLAHERSLFLSR